MIVLLSFSVFELLYDVSFVNFITKMKLIYGETREHILVRSLFCLACFFKKLLS